MISLDYRSGQPLYYQIVEGYKRLILSGVIAENERLPSVRELASTLAINPNTIQRAYRELETEGFVGTSPGKGIFAVGADTLREREVDAVFEKIGLEIQKLREYGWDVRDVLHQLSLRFGQKEAGGERFDINDKRDENI